MEIHHVGIATEDTNQSIETFRVIDSFPLAHQESFDGMKVTFLGESAPFLELLEPLESGPIKRFIDRDGPGIHHLAFEVSDLSVALAQASDTGIECIDETPRPGAWGHEVAFLHPRAFGGILVELVAAD